jgi:hypothetical protein
MKSSWLSTDVPYCPPGSSTAWPWELFAAASSSSPETLNPNLPSRNTVISSTQSSRIDALMICTQVVPFMPPTST